MNAMRVLSVRLLCLSVLAACAATGPVDRPRQPDIHHIGRAIGCTPEGDPYTLPTCMVELVLRDAGWNAHSLGTNLPLSELVPAIDHYKPRICWVSASYTESPRRLRDQLLQLVDAGRSRNADVVCGGRALSGDLRDDPAIRCLDSLQELQRFVAQIT